MQERHRVSASDPSVPSDIVKTLLAAARRKGSRRMVEFSGNHVQMMSLLLTLLKDLWPSSRIWCFQPRDSSDAWQLTCADRKRKALQTWTKLLNILLRPAFARTHLPVVLAVQETKSWDVEFFLWLQNWERRFGNLGTNFLM